MARFYANENIALKVVTELRRPGHDVLTSVEAGKANSAVPDSEVVAFATAERRVLLSHNRRHFLRLHEHHLANHAGIILLTFDSDFRGQAERIDESVRSLPDTSNRLIRVNRPG